MQMRSRAMPVPLSHVLNLVATLSILKPDTISDKHTVLICIRQADGNWQFNSTLACVLLNHLTNYSSCPAVSCKGSIREVWATILALVFLETVCFAKRWVGTGRFQSRRMATGTASPYHLGSIYDYPEEETIKFIWNC